jgi:zinc transport system ATP-binding protein
VVSDKPGLTIHGPVRPHIHGDGCKHG